ncbi:MAG: N-acylglucosamine 2-epimerase, partial [Spirochaetales bacterium]|nr:N-acylglucosamine 2-epimerase [Spirochaetales bacterium]
MNKEKRKKLFDFYSHELKDNILRFWLPRCLDKEFGGYLNCFDNRGKNLVSHDKYVWSQGRFLWMFSKLAVTKAPLFSEQERS